MGKTSRLLAILLVLTFIVPGVGLVVDAVEAPAELVDRIQGDSRRATAIEVSRKCPEGKVDTVVIVGNDGDADALTGTMLAASKNAPILITKKNEVEDILKKRLEEYENLETIYILGGEKVVSNAVVEELNSKYTVEQLVGKNRAETAVMASKEVKEKADHVFLAEGYDKLADALAIGPVSARDKLPVLLTRKGELPKETKDALKDMGVKKVTILGGTKSVSKDVEKEIKELKIELDERIFGDCRYDTAAKIAEKYFPESTKAIIAKGEGNPFADAIVGGNLGNSLNAPVLLTKTGELRDGTKEYIESKIEKAYVLGGERAVNEGVFATIKEIIEILIEKKLAVATKAVEKAEIDRDQKSVDLARKLVEVLPNGKDKIRLEVRLDAVQTEINEAEKPKGKFRICIDYGHGGTEPGAIFEDRKEKDDNLRLGKLITAELREKGIEVDETRTADETVTLQGRSSHANRNGKDYYDYFLSIHRNAYRPNEAQGSESFTYITKNPLSMKLATDIQRGLTEVGFADRGVKQADFHVLRRTFAPAVLVEVGFMDNAIDNKIFDENIDVIAKAIANAVIMQAK